MARRVKSLINRKFYIKETIFKEGISMLTVREICGSQASPLLPSHSHLEQLGKNGGYIRIHHQAALRSKLLTTPLTS